MIFKYTIIPAAMLAGGSVAATASPTPAKSETKEESSANKVAAVPGLGIANLENVITASAAFKSAQQQRSVTFKAALEQAAARRQQIAANLQMLVDKLNKDRTGTKMDAASFQQRSNEIQNLQNAGNQELANIVKPVALSDAYVREQITAKLPNALTAAMTKRGISVLIGPNDVLVSTSANSLDAAIVGELDAMLPAVQLVPPAGWAPKRGATPSGN